MHSSLSQSPPSQSPPSQSPPSQSPPSQSPPSQSILRPARALLHPVWWIALALLVANDHVFKGSGLLPAEVTGKLSDFVGLLVAPVLLAVVCRVRSARGFALSHVAVALGFAAINVSPAIAGMVETLMASTPFPWAIAVDPTDLIALPMVALSHALFIEWSAAPAPVGRVLSRAGLGIGMLACVATSSLPGPLVEPEPGSLIFPTEQAAVMIANETGTEQLIRVRALDPQVQLDCNYMAQDPTRNFAREWFGPAELWLVEPGRAIPIREDGPCTAYLIDGAELSPRLLFLGDSYRNQQLTTEAAAVPERNRVAVQLPSGAAEWGTHPALLPAPARIREPVEPLCQTVPEGFGVDWTTAPLGRRTLESLSTAPDGCTAFDFEASGAQSASIRWFVCAPVDVLPFEAGDELTLSALPQGQLGVEIMGPSGRVLLSRGTTIAADDVVSVSYAARDCQPTLACGLSVPVQPLLHHAEGQPTRPIVGTPTPMGRGMVTVARAEVAIAVDARCSDDPSAQPRVVLLESIFVETF
ncbi:MAG: hypothetical protein ACI9U2_004298 [Bradymonadia bacterium]|jgi:hypothetical protein